MGVARKQYTPDEKKAMVKMADEGWSYRQIAEKIRPGVKSAWRSVGDIVRQERRDQAEERARRERMAAQAAAQPSGAAAPPKATHIPHSQPQAKSSPIDLPDSLADSITAREMMHMLDDEQRELFVATYEDLRGEADEEQLTKAENEMLMRAAFSHVKYLRAQAMLARAESYIMLDLDGYLTNSDEDNAKKRFAGRADVYKKEAEQWHKEYMDLMNDLKLTRKQRLDKIKDTRNTFLDLQQELMSRARQDSIVEEIKRINHATKEEFYRMSMGEVGPDGQRHPWLLGAFDDVIDQEELSKRKEEGNEHST